MIGDALLAFDGHLRAGRIGHAKSLLKTMADHAPRDVDVRVSQARLLAITDVHEAIQDLEAVVTEAPVHADALCFLAALVDKTGDGPRALMLGRRAHERGSRAPEVLGLLGHDALAGENPEEAVQFFDEALANDSEIASLWFGKGHAHLQLDEPMLAEEAFVQGVTRDPSQADMWIRLIKLEIDAGAHDVARENIVVALRTHRDNAELLAMKDELNEDSDVVEALLVKTRNAIYDEDISGAKDILDTLMMNHDDDPRAMVAQAEIALAENDVKALPPIVHALQRMARETPMFWPGKTALGRALLRETAMQNPALAAAHCEDAWRISGEHPHAGLGLVEAWAAINKKAHARAILTRLATNEGREGRRARAIVDGQ